MFFSEWPCNRMTSVLGEPASLDQGCLPTKKSIYNLYKKVWNDGVESGKWINGSVRVCEVMKVVGDEVASQWGKTDIPTLFSSNPTKAKKELMKVVTKGKVMLKTKVTNRKSKFGEEFDTLLDLASCQHVTTESCDCSEENKVPVEWKEFLADQRGSRQLNHTLNKLRLQASTVFHPAVTAEEKEAQEEEKIRKKRQERKAEQQRKAILRSQREKSNLKRKIILESDTEEETEGSERKEEDIDTDSEWEDDEEGSDDEGWGYHEEGNDAW